MNYNKLKILNSKEKKGILARLNEQFGIREIKGAIIKKGKEKLFLFKGSFEPEEIKKLEKEVVIEKLGVYFAKIITDKRTQEKSIRLSIEGSQILKEQIIKNVFELNKEQTEDWMKGKELEIKSNKRGFLIMRSNEDFLGTGKASEEKISNFIPKSRRLKEKN